MNHTALDSTYRIDFNIRPVRIAYFLFADDEPGLARTIRLCCTQWGGLGHLIIPVSQPFSIAPLYRHLLEIHEP
ncbi:MAG TPA: hypothetical protein PLI59_05680, partial [Candidatus Obscuribacter sp.]|nr:hypothetical protein [Candidatus Obscuribacter sp.]